MIINGEYMSAPRFAWKRANGVLANDICVLHHCDTPACVNPEHLFLGDNKANCEDRDKKGRQAFGERASKAKLTWEKVREIRRLYRKGARGTTSGLGSKHLAAIFGVTYPTILALVKNQTWKEENLQCA